VNRTVDVVWEEGRIEVPVALSRWQMFKGLKTGGRNRALMFLEGERPLLDSFLVDSDIHLYYMSDGTVARQHRMSGKLHRPPESHDFVLLSTTDIRLEEGESVGLTEVDR
jgi:hypothetical protein